MEFTYIQKAVKLEAKPKEVRDIKKKIGKLN